jgi:hypothetical protein
MGVQELPRGVVVLLDRSARNRRCWTSWTHGMRRWSRIGSLCQLLREPQGSPARTRRNPPRPDYSGACTAGILAQPFARPPFPFCFHTNGPQPACAWLVALHTHMPAESSQAGHQQNTPARIRGRASPNPSGPLGPLTPPPIPPAATPSGPAYHRRRSCAARRTRAALLRSRPPHR